MVLIRSYGLKGWNTGILERWALKTINIELENFNTLVKTVRSLPVFQSSGIPTFRFNHSSTNITEALPSHILLSLHFLNLIIYCICSPFDNKSDETINPLEYYLH